MSKEVNIVVLEGDGVAKEVCAEAEETLKFLHERYAIPLKIIKYPCGGAYWLETGKQWPEEAQMACANDADAILFGGVGWPGAVLPWGAPAGLDVIFWLRKQLDLFANVRRIKALPGVGQRVGETYKEVYDPTIIDLILVRENTEGLYTSPRGVDLTRGMITELKTDVRICTRKGIERLAHFGFSLAQKEMPMENAKVTCIDKSNVVDSCRLFRAVFQEIAEQYQGIDTSFAYIDNFALDVLENPGKYRICVTSNMYGDILSDLLAFFEGGSGVGAAANFGKSKALFEPMHGPKPDLAGKGLVNPMGIHNCIVLMLEWLGDLFKESCFFQIANNVRAAMVKTIQQERILPIDLGGNASTREFSTALRRQIDGGVE